MKHHPVGIGVLLAVMTFCAAVSAGPEVEPTYLTLSGGTFVIAAIYTPYVWASVAKSDRGQEDIVRIACREPGSPNSELVDQPWQVALVDSPSALSWQQPDAERPLWIVNAPELAAQSGVPDLARFTVVAGFRPDQLAKRKYVILYRSMTEGKRSAMEFRPDRLPDPVSLRWRE